MLISYKDNYYFLDFTDSFNEKIFFINSINLSFTLIKESVKHGKQISEKIYNIILKMIKYQEKNKFILKISEDLFKVKKEYLDILLEHIQTVLMILLKEEKKVLEHSLKAQYEFLNDFFERFLFALKEESKK
jgi:hypothetical protein